MILHEGDEVAIVAPASAMTSTNQGLVTEAASLLESWGLVVRLNLDHQPHMYLSGSDSERTVALELVFADDAIKAVFCTRGGYGSQRLLRMLDLSSAGPKLFVGFSDLTALHLAAIAQRSALELIHGPNVATTQFLADTADAERNRADLHRLLFDGGDVEAPVTPLVPGEASGPLLGGCLSIVAAQVGTPYLPPLDESILFLEDIGESPYKVDRMLHQLRNAGVVDRVSGVVFGTMHDCVDPYNRIEDVIVDVLGDLGVPIAFGLPSGHGPRNTAIRLNAPTTLKNKTVTQSQGTVHRDSESGDSAP